MEQKVDKMQKDYSEKITFTITPCKAPDPCLDYEDYDPCESSENITEKDLAVLLKEEQAKLRQNQEAQVLQQDKLRQDQEAQVLQQDKLRQDQEAEVLQQDSSIQKNQLQENAGKQTAKSEPPPADVDDRCHTLKKRLCKKLIKNPFFTNRLKFSIDLPPPPPSPPPQFLPRVYESDSESKICSRRKRKCKKKAIDLDTEIDERKGKEKKKEKDESADEGTKEEVDEGADENRDSWDTNKRGEDEKSKEDSGMVKTDEDAESKYGNKNGNKNGNKGKTRCKKPERPPCRKASEMSVTFQPRQIPMLQKDLPPVSPKALPEVERQLKMACRNQGKIDCSKKKCNKK